MTAPPDRLTVHTSWRGLATAVASPMLLLAFATVLLTATGPGPVAILSLLVGLGLALVTLLDYPRRAEFGPDGVVRVCLLRRQLLPWADLVAIERTGGSARDALRPRTEGPKPAKGGLVARGLGRRRFLLTDRVESRREFDRLRELIEHLGVPTTVRAGRPGEDVPPTDLYRRRRHRPEEHA